MTRLIDADRLMDVVEEIDWYHLNKRGEMVHGANSDYHQPWYKWDEVHNAIRNAPEVEAIPVEWIKKLIEEDRKCAEKAKEEKNEKVFRFHKRLEICISQMLFDWEFENGKYKEFDDEIWQD